jgi:CHAD domain-containing protein
MRTLTPVSVLQHQVSELLSHLDGVREGQEEAIHDARVSTRRVRETLAVATANFDEHESTAIGQILRQAGRALGEVRESDVLHHLLVDLDMRVPVACAPMTRLRGLTSDAQQAGRRRVIKTLEALDLRALPRRLAHARQRRLPLFRDRSGWRNTLRNHVGARSERVRAVVEHGSGVYFPNRAHSTRLAIKQLRYALELAHAVDMWQLPRAIRRLRKAQDTLGQARDRQVLIDRLRALVSQDGSDGADVQAVVRVIDAEIHAFYRKYLDLRSELAAICNACDRFAQRFRAGRTALVAAGLAVPSLILLGRHRPAATAEGPEAENVRVNVRVASPV